VQLAHRGGGGGGARLAERARAVVDAGGHNRPTVGRLRAVFALDCRRCGDHGELA